MQMSHKKIPPSYFTHYCCLDFDFILHFYNALNMISPNEHGLVEYFFYKSEKTEHSTIPKKKR